MSAYIVLYNRLVLCRVISASGGLCSNFNGNRLSGDDAEITVELSVNISAYKRGEQLVERPFYVIPCAYVQARNGALYINREYNWRELLTL